MFLFFPKFQISQSYGYLALLAQSRSISGLVIGVKNNNSCRPREHKEDSNQQGSSWRKGARRHSELSEHICSGWADAKLH